ncbi:RAM signaling pathway protein [Xylariales sp. PMI_506]|nr:RAM signaling pathway protein [Xylariales sp. PMI_506]
MPSSQSSSGRGLPANPAQGRRIQTSLSNMPPPPPIPEKFHASMNSWGSTLSANGALSAGQVINLAREAMKTALRDNESQAAEASGVSTELKPGVTVDLSRKNIQELPDEVVDIIKHELERLALSHNKISSFPARFSECTSLRYLNVRNNFIKEFPLPLCDLKSLEILDLGRNKIKILPPEIAKLASLKVLAVQKNRIEELPLCLGDMSSLQVLKLDGNNIIFPPREVLQVQASSPPNEGFLKESEVTEVTVTAHIKKFLKQKITEKAERTAEIENGVEDFMEGLETPRFPLKRVASGRFPIKVNGVDAPELRSPNIPRPPPIPSRSHARGLSQQSTSIRKSGVMPLTIGNPNERLRSNSETLLQVSRAERPGERQRRLMSKRANELGTLDETQANNRFSHYRGLSHGSSMTGSVNNNGVAIISPNSPAEPLLQRPNYVRRLSVLPEQRRESKAVDPIIESAKGILYAIFQVHPMIQLFTRLTNDGTSKRSSLEIVFYNTNVHVEELEQEIMKHESVEQGRYTPRENENVQRAVLTLINAYSHICSILINNMATIVENGDPRYIRTLMLCIYNSITELRATANEASIGLFGSGSSAQPRRLAAGNTTKPHSRESSATPTIDRVALGGSRSRNGQFTNGPSNLRVATDASMPYINGTGRTATITSATPRSGESFASNSTDGRYASDVTQDERHFEKIFLSLSKSSDLLMRTLPNFNIQFNSYLREAKAQRAPEHILQCWRALIGRCTYSIQQTDLLKGRLSAIKFKEPGIRTDPGFWALCKSFADAWAEFGSTLKNAMDQIALPMDIRSRLRPIQLTVKETTQLILASPWAGIFRNAGQFLDGSNYFSPGHYSSNSNATQTQLPVTPQSAALGPAVQATVPSTPQSASFVTAFSGNVFERADALISMGGISMSRTGTSSSMTNSSFSSISSMTSSNDDRYGPATMLSPNYDMGPSSFRRNGGGGKPGF